MIDSDNYDYLQRILLSKVNTNRLILLIKINYIFK